MPYLPTSNAAINKIQRFVLFLASMILIFSLFFDTKIIDNSIVQKGAFAFVVIGLIWWVLEEIFGTIISYIDSTDCTWSKETKKIVYLVLTSLWFAVLIVGILVGVSLVLPRFISIISFRA